ncbi:MAG: peptide-methionine (S)-S-oxide reductase MsrA [Saprospiraceae bacterium]|nr:peptide-methionine (S)-S-oxide reductase MsrA [Saprospiraceae bacterium]
MDPSIHTATFGTGCFWCTEAMFLAVRGVSSVMPGYAGGHVENPTYEEVCGKKSGHAEVIQIEFDPSVVTYGDLLEMFWRSHDPTTLNRQGNDVGPQYRSAIFFHDEDQHQQAEASKAAAEAAKLWPDPIVTEIAPLTKFYPAEDYHQNYYARVGDRNPYCTFVVSPKVKKFKELFQEKLK